MENKKFSLIKKGSSDSLGFRDIIFSDYSPQVIESSKHELNFIETGRDIDSSVQRIYCENYGICVSSEPRTSCGVYINCSFFGGRHKCKAWHNSDS